uniref:deoxyribonuclease II n=1 Tax=Mola mola TaxID=94237 RepID=A0A3Q3WH33_MOLML
CLCLCLQIVVLLLCCKEHSADISCRNGAGEPVDWCFIIYKLPRYKIGEVASGVDYMYLDSSVGSWQTSNFQSRISREHTETALYGKGLQDQYFPQSKISLYALYNDYSLCLTLVCVTEKAWTVVCAHPAGVLLFDHSQGFWLSHSIPLLSSFPERGYLYPSSGKVNSHTALCVTYEYQQFLCIVKQMSYLYPRFYNCSVPATFLAELLLLAQLCEGTIPLLPSERRMEQLFSLRGEKFFSFVKSEQFLDDIYTGWVAPVLDADLLVETWQRLGHELPSNCSLPKHTMNIRRIQLPASALFHSHYDHSKWCVPRAYEDQLNCLGDLNRERAQMWHGAGLLSSFNPVIYKAFREVVDWYIGC